MVAANSSATTTKYQSKIDGSKYEQQWRRVNYENLHIHRNHISPLLGTHFCPHKDLVLLQRGRISLHSAVVADDRAAAASISCRLNSQSLAASHRRNIKTEFQKRSAHQ